MRSFAFMILLSLVSTMVAGAELDAPAQANLDSKVTVTVTGEVDPRSFVSIVSPDAAEGTYGDYAYTRSAEVVVQTPAEAGRFEVRLLGAQSPYPTLARRPIELVKPDASLEAPATVDLGNAFEIGWSGPSASQEYVTIVPADTPDGQYQDYAYARGEGSGTVSLTAPTKPGAYEVRFMTGRKGVVLARHTVTVGDVDASLTFPEAVSIGEALEIAWTGPDQPLNFVTIVAPDAPIGNYGDYVYTKTSPVTLTAPETPGVYEVRYLTNDSKRVLARGSLTVGAASATVDAVSTVEAGTDFEVTWTGPDNAYDYVAVTVVDTPTEYRSYAYTRRGSPLILRAPDTAGRYELHYLTGRSDLSLASRPIEVTPGRAPGHLRVLSPTADGGERPATGAVELILDASGSMLQKIEGTRRIALARTALERLIDRSLAPGTPVALRVFGHRKPDACDTALVQPLAPLDRDALRATVRGIEAKNLAKTPIAASLAAVANDLAGVEGPAVVVLVTDGEETCDGDPAAEIERLRAQGLDVVINVVGFAIDERALEREFQRWAELGGGAYFGAQDGDGLADGIAQAMRPPFGVYLDGQRVASGVAGGGAVELPPGTYEVRLGGQRQSVTITSGDEHRLTFGDS